ncbi:hypothetical protein [Nonomuraea glycinis]|uniref:hypothetical protein n=1 Tax=Nonomuraea glycinis TaxID=2047744 RepID=UPI002E0DC230|nr:hypothetical protein OHA68_21270 [Nonomuraea glycinis]
MELNSPDFTDATFHGRVLFSNVSMSGRCDFQNVQHNYAIDQGSAPRKPVRPILFDGFHFTNIVVDEAIELKGWKSSGEVRLSSITSDKALEVSEANITSLSVWNTNGLSFIAYGKIAKLHLSRCRFTNGGQIRIEKSEISIEQCLTSAPMSIATVSFGDQPAIHALNGTDLNNFIFSGLDLAVHARLFFSARIVVLSCARETLSRPLGSLAST